MALIVFLRGINVGGHRTFRPSVLARQLAGYEVVNVGAAGTFVVRRPGPRARFLAELRKRLPFEAVIATCDARDLIRLEGENPFGTASPRRDTVRFVSILVNGRGPALSLPIAIPEGGEPLVRVIGSKGRFLFGEHRRHMRTIAYLGQLDRLFGASATTRGWGTILSILRIVRRADGPRPRGASRQA